jgi:hypothetical protein
MNSCIIYEFLYFLDLLHTTSLCIDSFKLQWQKSSVRYDFPFENALSSFKKITAKSAAPDFATLGE